MSAEEAFISAEPNIGGGRILAEQQKLQNRQNWHLWICVVATDRMLVFMVLNSKI